MAEVPRKYDDPYWVQLADAAGAKAGLPQGLLTAILLHGERSNNDQVSSAQARTPFQIIPATRRAFLDKYGIDAYLNPQNAATVGALHLKESMDRNDGDPVVAIAEYNTSPGNVKAARARAEKEGDPASFVRYLPAETRAYVPRTVAGWQSISPDAAPKTADLAAQATPATQGTPEQQFQAVMQRQGQGPTDQVFSIYNAYRNGQMSAVDAAQYEADASKNPGLIPFGGSLIGREKRPAGNAGMLPDGVLKAYQGGKMLREDMIELEGDVARGLWKLPEGVKLGTTEPRGAVGTVIESVTGKDRSTDTTRALPEWVSMPELNQMSGKGALTGLGTLTAGPQEAVKIIQAQFPGVKARQDEKGNYIVKSSIDGKEYAFTPGFTVGDIPRALAGVASFAPAAAARTVVGSALANAGTAAAIEASQAAAGGDFNVGDVALAGGIGAAVPAVTAAARVLRTPAQNLIGDIKPAITQDTAGQLAGRPGGELMPPSATAESTITGRAPLTIEGAAPPAARPNQTLSPTGEQLSQGSIRQPGRYIRDEVPERSPTEATITGQTDAAIYPTTETGARAVNLAEEIAPRSTPAGEAAASRATTGATAEADNVGMADLLRRATGGGMDAIRAQEELATLARVDAKAAEAAKRLGIEVPADVFADNTQLRAAAGLARSQAGSTAEAGWRETTANASRRADDIMASMDASKDLSSVSQGVLSGIQTARNDLLEKAEALYKPINAAIDKADKAQFPTLGRTLREVLGESPNTLSAEERRLSALVKSKTATYGDLLREKDNLGSALKGKGPYAGTMTEGAIKRLYGAIAEDQLKNVARIAGTEARDKMREANRLYAQKSALDKRIVNAFGNETEGSVASLMRRAIETGAKGDVTAINKLLKVVPPELHKEVVASAILSASSATQGAGRGGFGFAQFAKTYEGLRNNAQIMGRIGEILGPTNKRVLDDLYTVSRRLYDAEQNVLKTGKANQGMGAALKAESLLGRLLEKIPANMAAAGGYIAGGPTGSIAARGVVGALMSERKDVVAAVGRLLESPDFQKMLLEAAAGDPGKEIVRKVARSSQFAEFAKRIGAPREPQARERWLRALIESEGTQQ